MLPRAARGRPVYKADQGEGMHMKMAKQIRSVVRKAVTLATVGMLAFPSAAFACTQVYVGSDFTDTGDTYVGRSEDYSSRYAKLFGVQEPLENPTYVSDESNFSWTYEGTSYRYTYVRDAESEWGEIRPYSEAGTNEKGVSVSATESTNMNSSIRAVDPLSDTGIGEFNIPDVVLGTCATAREGVERLGGLVDAYGSSECNQIIIADNTEAWLFMQLSGHQWLAFVMPDDQVSVNPNLGCLQFKVDLEDESVCLHSEGLESTAEEASTYTEYEDGTMNVAASYGGTSTASPRYVQGHLYFGDNMVEGTDYTVSDGKVASITDPQLLFTPGESATPVSLADALRSLAARGEQSSSSAVNANLGASSAIGSQSTTEAHIFQIRSGLSADIATVEWIALSPAEFNVYLPVYGALLTEVDEAYYPNEADIDTSHTNRRDGLNAALTDIDSQSIDYLFMDINTIANAYRSSMAEGVRAYLDAMQASIIEQQEAVDAAMQALPAGAARTELANRAFQQATEQLYAKGDALLDEMRAYVAAGDTSTPFVPSDYDAQTDSMKEPFVYSGAAVAPSITTQPASATYEQGAEAQPLTVAATAGDGVDGSDELLSYQWYVADGTASTASGLDAFTALEGETTSELAVSTDAVGTKTYAVVVTNAAGLTTVSDAAVITVTEPKREEETPKPEDTTDVTTKDDGGTKKPSGDVDGGTLVQTSDSMPVQALAVMTAAGVLALGAGLVVRRRS